MPGEKNDNPDTVRVAFETARLRLAEIKAEGAQARQQAYRAACERSARTLNVERVSIWFLSLDCHVLSRALQYTLSTSSFEEGGELRRENCERYFEALQSQRVVAASDPLNDPRTAQLEAYLRREGVQALLDAPIYRDGRVVGVVCHEHVGSPRDWTEREAGFASAVADLLTILIHQAERAELRAAVDARRELESQHQKMQALVRMARVVVHDLGNVLMVALGRASELPDDPDPRQVSSDIVDVLSYGGKLLGQLRAFCEQRDSRERVELVSFLQGMSATLQTLLGRQVRFRLECSAVRAEVAATPVEAEQLILNLCMNARDAIADQGEVSVSLSNVDDGVLLEVKDTGCGMDEPTQRKVFEPFYSTKPGHSGVGLAAVYGIVERANGRLSIDSALGRGTSFRIVLPRVEKAASAEMPWAF
jgi:two-component system cell cycle sensor histidine kinase/response regulator CckA